MIKRFIRLGLVVGAIALVVWASGGVMNIFKSPTAYAAGDLTVDWHVPAGAPIFSITNAAPGRSESRTVTVTNSSPTNQPVAVRGILKSETASLSGVLNITISQNGTDVYGPKKLSQFFAESNGPDGIALGNYASGQTKDVVFKVDFDQNAGNEYQNASITFDLQIGVAFSIPSECGSMSQYGAPIYGTSGNDKILGTNKRDLIIGFEGNDKIDGGNNDDCIVGGPGNNKLDGGNGNDVITSESGNDVIDGGNGGDVIYAGGGNDKIEGGNEADVVYAGDGDDVMSGGNGADQLFGGAGVDKADGGNGKDTCEAETKQYCEQ